MNTITVNIDDVIKNAANLVRKSAGGAPELSRIEIDKLTVNRDKSYVYVFFVDGEVVYVGKSSDLKNRLTQHSEGAAESVSTKHKEITEVRGTGKKVTFTVIEIDPECFNSTIETALIKEFKPKWNDRDS